MILCVYTVYIFYLIKIFDLVYIYYLFHVYGFCLMGSWRTFAAFGHILLVVGSILEVLGSILTICVDVGSLAAFWRPKRSYVITNAQPETQFYETSAQHTASFKNLPRTAKNHTDQQRYRHTLYHSPATACKTNQNPPSLKCEGGGVYAAWRLQ